MKTKLQKRKDNPNSGYWRRKANEEWRKRVIAWWHGKCAIGDVGISRCAGKLECHHLITRSVRSLANDTRNGILLCSNHHKFCSHLSAHKAPLAFAEWLDTEHASISAWVKANKWTVGKADFRGDYQRLDCPRID